MQVTFHVTNFREREKTLKRFLVLEKYLHIKLTLCSVVSKCKTAIKMHFVFHSQQVKNYYHFMPGDVVI